MLGLCHGHCNFQLLGTKKTEKVLLFVTLSLFVSEICKNVYFDGGHLEKSNKAILASSIVIHISKLGSFVPKTPEMWSCLLLYDCLLARTVKMCFMMAAILNRPIWQPL